MALATGEEILLESIIGRSLRDERRIREKTAAHLLEARKEAMRLSGELSRLEGLRSVLHFGSSLTGRHFRLDSDIDLAVSGGDILEGMRIAEDSAFPVDVIDIDRVPSPLREAIIRAGVVIYEKR